MEETKMRSEEYRESMKRKFRNTFLASQDGAEVLASILSYCGYFSQDDGVDPKLMAFANHLLYSLGAYDDSNPKTLVDFVRNLGGVSC